jgi:hypothetical protein
LVPLVRYRRGDTVSERIREILDPERDIDALPPRGERSRAGTWHSPSEQPTRTLDPQDPAPPAMSITPGTPDLYSDPSVQSEAVPTPKL